MAGTEFRFLACDALTNTRLGYLDLQNVSFNDPLTGIGTLRGSAPVSRAQTRDKLDLLTQPDTVALYVVADGAYWWPGLITSAPWNPDTRSRDVTATHWKSWLHRRFAGPNPATNPVTDVVYSYTATDQLTIAAGIVATATAPAGCPTITLGGETSGVLRDLNWAGSDFRFTGDLIDSMATRAKGFDWTVVALPDGITGLPTLRFAPYYPARGAAAPALVFKKTPAGGNYTLTGTIENTAAARRTRVWATGKGSPPDRKMVYDEDPGVAADTTLLSETVTGYTSVDTVATLATNARAERAFLAVPAATAQAVVYFGDVPPGLYGTGDRVQFVYLDEGVDLDLPAARIIDRVLNINTAGADNAVLTIDLTDAQLPSTIAEQ